jgi:maltokinase
VAPPGERGAFDTPVRDVAAFVRSIDHVGRIASRRRPGREDSVESWIARSRAAFLGAYRGELEAAGADRLFDERLLRPLEVAQECHEYVYAARFLPRWRYVPDLATRALFPTEDR